MTYTEEATAKMEAARKERDSAKGRHAQLKAYDKFLYWQGVVSDLRILAVRQAQ